MSGQSGRAAGNRMESESDECMERQENTERASSRNSNDSTTMNVASNEVDEQLHCDTMDIGHQPLMGHEIVKNVLADDASVDSGDSSNATPASDSRKKAKEAADSLQKFIDWYQKQPEADATMTLFLRKQRRMALQQSES